MPNSEIYLDNSATTRPFEEVIEYMNEIYRCEYGNPSSLNRMGIRAEAAVKKARNQIASSLNAKASEVYFTSGGTESNSLALFGYLKANPRRGNHIITSKVEHPSVLEAFKAMENSGYEVDYIGVTDEGFVNAGELIEKLRSNTALVSIMLVNNETGAISPIDEISRIIKLKNPNTALHVDAVQAYGKMHINPEKLGIQFLSFSSHKIHGPKGIGGLYVGKGVKVEPIFYGGGQEFGLRSGTENVPGIAGFGLAAELSIKAIDENMAKCLALKEQLIAGIQSNIDNTVVISGVDSFPYILNVSFLGLKAEVLLHFLEDRNIFVSTGSACHSKRKIKSHVLTAMNLKPELIDGAIRFSFSQFNTKEEINIVIRELADIVPQLRKTYDKGK